MSRTNPVNLKRTADIPAVLRNQFEERVDAEILTALYQFSQRAEIESIIDPKPFIVGFLALTQNYMPEEAKDFLALMCKHGNSLVSLGAFHICVELQKKNVGTPVENFKKVLGLYYKHISDGEKFEGFFPPLFLSPDALHRYAEKMAGMPDTGNPAILGSLLEFSTITALQLWPSWLSSDLTFYEFLLIAKTLKMSVADLNVLFFTYTAEEEIQKLWVIQLKILSGISVTDGERNTLHEKESDIAEWSTSDDTTEENLLMFFLYLKSKGLSDEINLKYLIESQKIFYTHAFDCTKSPILELHFLLKKTCESIYLFSSEALERVVRKIMFCLQDDTQRSSFLSLVRRLYKQYRKSEFPPDEVCLQKTKEKKDAIDQYQILLEEQNELELKIEQVATRIERLRKKNTPVEERPEELLIELKRQFYVKETEANACLQRCQVLEREELKLRRSVNERTFYNAVNHLSTDSAVSSLAPSSPKKPVICLSAAQLGAGCGAFSPVARDRPTVHLSVPPTPGSGTPCSETRSLSVVAEEENTTKAHMASPSGAGTPGCT